MPGAAPAGLLSVTLRISSLLARDHEMEMTAKPAFYRAVRRQC